MLEVLFVLGMLGLLLGTLWEYLSSLAAFPTLVVAFFAVPLLAWADYLKLLARYHLEGIGRKRLPVPPERFYWSMQKRWLRYAIYLWPAGVILAWYVALEYPATLTASSQSTTGWAAGLLAIVSTARLMAASILYVRASQWFDKMTPWAIGFCRTTLYRISDNPDFLDSVSHESPEKDKSVY